MGFPISPAVNVSEIDLTTVVPGLGTTGGAFAGAFQWGPVLDRTLVDSELVLVNRFGKPNDDTFKSFFTCADYLAYANNLTVVRVVGTAAKNAVCTGSAILVKNEDHYENTFADGTNSVGPWAAKYPGTLGNSLKVSIADQGNYGTWAYKDEFDSAPGTSEWAEKTGATRDELHVVVVDEDGLWTGVQGEILEKFGYLSKASDAKSPNGASIYYMNVVNRTSKYIWWMDHPTTVTNWGIAAGTTRFDLLSTSVVVVTGTHTGTFEADEDVVVYEAILDTLSVDVPGTGYVTPPTIAFSGGGGIDGEVTQATGHVHLTEASLDNFIIEDAGSGFTEAPTITFSGGGRTGASGATQATGHVHIGITGADTGKIIDVNIDTSGTNYTCSPTITLHATTGAEPIGTAAITAIMTTAGGATGSIASAHVDTPGSGYTLEPTITLTVTSGGSNGVILPIVDRTDEYVIKTAVVDSWTVGTHTLMITPTLGELFVQDEPIVGVDSGATADVDSVTTPTVAYSLTGGVTTAPADGDIETGLDEFVNAETVDVGLILTGAATTQVAEYAIDNIAEVRKDCVVFISPLMADVVNNPGDEADDIVVTRNALTSSSYAFMDGNWYYRYDKYNDRYRWVPCNGSVAGLAARTDEIRDPWYSFAGLNRGILKNVVKLAWNPSKAFRDQLYKSGVNSIVSFQGQGTVLYGDKTLLSKPSAFDRINVRRLFIVLEKSIATAAKYTLFEFNDEFTRAQFRTLIEPFLRDVQGRRGIFDFKVVCDTTNNTPEVIDTNRFIGDIYVKPARSINFIQLNFCAVRTGVAFEEIVGKF